MLSKNTPSHFDNTKEAMKELYEVSGKLMIAPLYVSYSLITAPKGGNYDFSSLSRGLGWISLPGTLLVSCVTIPVGILGGLGASIYGAVAVPVSLIKDKIDKDKQTAHLEKDSNQSGIQALGALGGNVGENNPHDTTQEYQGPTLKFANISPQHTNFKADINNFNYG